MTQSIHLPDMTTMTMQRGLAIAATLASLGYAGALHAQATSVAPVKPPDRGKWQGTIRSSIVTAGSAGNAEATRYTGNVYIVPSESGREGMFKLELRLSGNRGGESLEWAVSPGRCGSPLLPLIQPNELPPLDVRQGGEAELRFEGAFNLTPNAAYHLDIMRNGHSQANIVACADVKYQKPDK